MPKENSDITIMKAVIARAKELEKNLPENPKQLTDTFVIGILPNGNPPNKGHQAPETCRFRKRESWNCTCIR